MRKFKSEYFPNSDTHAPSFFVFNQFPTDIALVVLEHCSPFDLVQLGLSSRHLRAFIAANKHLWIQAQANLLGLPSLPAVEASGNFSQSAYATWLFGGGRCTWCSKWVDSQPCHFVFRFRACSTSCRDLLCSQANFYLDRAHKYDNFFWGKWLPRIERTSENGETFQIYHYQATADAERERQQAIRADAGDSQCDPQFVFRTSKQLDEEYKLRERSRPAILKNAAALETWHKLYLQEHAAVSTSNYEFLKRMCTDMNKKAQGVMRCPTIARLYRAFSMDLALITHTIWTQNLKLVLAEFKFLNEGVFPSGMPARRNDKVRCALCPRLVTVGGMKAHMLDKHREKTPPPDPFPVREGKEKRCDLCPRSTRLYTTRGLKDHQITKHLAPKSPSPLVLIA